MAYIRQSWLCSWVALVLVLVCASLSVAVHGAWHDHYTSAQGMPCCGKRDCVVVRARLLHQNAEETAVEVEGQPYMVPTRSVHASEDMHDWACWAVTDRPNQLLRCLFLAIGT